MLLWMPSVSCGSDNTASSSITALLPKRAELCVWEGSVLWSVFCWPRYRRCLLPGVRLCCFPYCVRGRRETVCCSWRVAGEQPCLLCAEGKKAFKVCEEASSGAGPCYCFILSLSSLLQ